MMCPLPCFAFTARFAAYSQSGLVHVSKDELCCVVVV